MTQKYSIEDRKQWFANLPGVPGSAAVLLEKPSGGLLVLKANYREYWSTPGGVMDKGESPKQAALREVIEETGIALDPETVTFCSFVYRTSDIVDPWYQFVFKAPLNDVTADTVVLQESEIEDYAFVTKDQVLSSEKRYAPLVTRWANNDMPGYMEEVVDLLND